MIDVNTKLNLSNVLNYTSEANIRVYDTNMITVTVQKFILACKIRVLNETFATLFRNNDVLEAYHLGRGLYLKHQNYFCLT